MRCSACGWPLSRDEVVSRHATSQGEVRYLRCPCGRIAVELRAPAPRLLAVADHRESSTTPG